MLVKVLKVYAGVSAKSGKDYYMATVLLGNIVKNVFLFKNEYEDIKKELDKEKN